MVIFIVLADPYIKYKGSILNSTKSPDHRVDPSIYMLAPILTVIYKVWKVFEFLKYKPIL